MVVYATAGLSCRFQRSAISDVNRGPVALAEKTQDVLFMAWHGDHAARTNPPHF